MFELLKQPKFDFMAGGPLLLGLSALLMVGSLTVLLVQGLKLGIEFTGGTELQLKYAQAPDMAGVRAALERSGLSNPIVTTIGDASEHEIYIRLASAVDEAKDKDLSGQVVAALRGERGGRKDLNLIDEAGMASLLQQAPGVSPELAESLSQAILERRKEKAIFESLDDLADLDGFTPEVRAHLTANSDIGPLAVRSQSYIGPAIGKELMNKAGLAIGGSLVGMLLYIAVRFQLQWGLAAVVALVHDTTITLGLFSLFGKELSLPVVAAFLTLIGYSVNDTVVVFDRIRENMRLKGGTSLQDTINASINQTLSRTIVTSGLTWVVVFALYLFGGAALNPFAFVLTAGVIVGTYSSIYIASPLLVIYRRLLDRRGAGGAGEVAEASSRRAKRVRRSSSKSA